MLNGQEAENLGQKMSDSESDLGPIKRRFFAPLSFADQLVPAEGRAG